MVFQEASVAKFGFPDAVLYDKDADLGKATTVWLIDAQEDLKFNTSAELSECCRGGHLETPGDVLHEQCRRRRF